jgi:hypothetical protein
MGFPSLKPKPQGKLGLAMSSAYTLPHSACTCHTSYPVVVLSAAVSDRRTRAHRAPLQLTWYGSTRIFLRP